MIYVQFFPVMIAVMQMQMVSPQTISGGSCSKSVETVADFDVNKYTGRWYEHEKYPAIFEFGGKCIYAEYHDLGNNEVSVFNFQKNKLSGLGSSITGTAKVVSSGKLEVRFDGFAALAGPGNYWVLGTDYENFSVVYSCSDFVGVVNTKVIWILTRQRFPEEKIVAQARDVIASHGFSLTNLVKTDHSHCD
uniref:Apolipoprotein D n=1 Tax=Glossina morsitans morsitans TaxID=37546 RepID=A0A1B0G8V7_GLOMM